MGQLCAVVAEMICLLYDDNAVDRKTGKVADYVFNPDTGYDQKSTPISMCVNGYTFGWFSAKRYSVQGIACYIQRSCGDVLRARLKSEHLPAPGTGMYIKHVTIRESVDLEGEHGLLMQNVRNGKFMHIRLSNVLFQGLGMQFDLRGVHSDLTDVQKHTILAQHVALRLQLRTSLSLTILATLGATIERPLPKGKTCRSTQLSVEQDSLASESLFDGRASKRVIDETHSKAKEKRAQAENGALKSKNRELQNKQEEYIQREKEIMLKLERAQAQVQEYNDILGKTKKSILEGLDEVSLVKELRRHSSDVWAREDPASWLKDMSRRVVQRHERDASVYSRSSAGIASSMSKSSSSNSLPQACGWMALTPNRGDKAL
jgi:hypothetical protein